MTTSITPDTPVTTGVVHRDRPNFKRHDELLAIPAAPGKRDQMPASEILKLFPTLPNWPVPSNQYGHKSRITEGGSTILEWLQTHEGDGWQERWVSSGADLGMEWVNDLVHADSRSEKTARSSIVPGLTSLLLCQIVRPSYDFLNAYRAVQLFTFARQVFCPELFARLSARAQETDTRGGRHKAMLVVITKIVMHTGRAVDQLTADDLLTYRAWRMAHRRATQNSGGTNNLSQAWALLSEFTDLGHRSLKDAVRHGQLTTAELVDRHRLQCRPVRDVLVRYLDERRPSMDYSSFTNLVTIIAARFWADLEQHHPGIDSLRLPRDVADSWKQRIRTITRRDGTTRPRKNFHTVMLLVRAFYRDMQEWSHEDPSWAKWNVPSPVRKSDIVGLGKAKLRTTAEIHQRIRERLPHLPELVEAAERRKAEQTSFHAAASSVDTGQTFEHSGRTYRRVLPAVYSTAYRQDSLAPLKVQDVASGELIDVDRNEHEAFWAWAIIEVLRHTGVRIEELMELTHLGVVSYQLRDTKEIVPMLQVVPSKSNEERLLLVGPELASVLAAIISRLRAANKGAIPLTSRYDPAERVVGPILPHLFQHRTGFHWEVFSPVTIQKLLTQILELTGLTDAAGAPLHCTPHDFRRMFATDAVSGGLPIHIVAKLLGHESLNTTQAYTAVFDEDLVRSYRSFLDGRRSLRPEAEYREPTDEEWHEFNEHFQFRKLELGECGRPYGTPCKHEHACIRCPSLRLDHRARPRLTEIIDNLRDRIQEAKLNGWLGEVKGLETSLQAAATKLVALDRMQERQQPTGPVSLGIPVIKPSD